MNNQQLQRRSILMLIFVIFLGLLFVFLTGEEGRNLGDDKNKGGEVRNEDYVDPQRIELVTNTKY